LIQDFYISKRGLHRDRSKLSVSKDYKNLRAGRNRLGLEHFVGHPTRVGDVVVDTVDRFLRFAAECEAMAELSPIRENKLLWNGLSERWRRRKPGQTLAQLRMNGPPRTEIELTMPPVQRGYKSDY
jgi:hypothetical protein